MLLCLQFIPHQVLQCLGVDRALQLAGLDLLDIAGHVAFDRLKSCASEHVEQGSHSICGFEKFGGGDCVVGLDVDIVERLLAVKVRA